MPLRVACPNCRSVYACPDGLRGKTLRCKKCGRTFAAAASEGVANAPAAPASSVQVRPAPQRTAAPRAAAIAGGARIEASSSWL